MNINLSSLPKTWIFDIDGTIVKHNGYKSGKDILLDGVLETFNKIPDTDMIIIITSRNKKFRSSTEKFLRDNGIRYNIIIFDAPVGERVLINDDKLSGLCMSYAIRKSRDSELEINYSIDDTL